MDRRRTGIGMVLAGRSSAKEIMHPVLCSPHGVCHPNSLGLAQLHSALYLVLRQLRHDQKLHR